METSLDSVGVDGVKRGGGGGMLLGRSDSPGNNEAGIILKRRFRMYFHLRAAHSTVLVCAEAKHLLY